VRLNNRLNHNHFYLLSKSRDSKKIENGRKTHSTRKKVQNNFWFAEKYFLNID